MSKVTAELLACAANLIEPPGAWTQHVWARNVLGNASEPRNPTATCWCLIGALRKCSVEQKEVVVSEWPDALYYAAHRAVSRVLREHEELYADPAMWNDRPERTQEEAIALLREVALSEEALP